MTTDSETKLKILLDLGTRVKNRDALADIDNKLQKISKGKNKDKISNIQDKIQAFNAHVTKLIPTSVNRRSATSSVTGSQKPTFSSAYRQRTRPTRS